MLSTKRFTRKIRGEQYERTGFDGAPELSATSRGFCLLEFEDRYGQRCSLQESSLATEAAVWFGVDVNRRGEAVNVRMHLTQDQVRALLPLLKRFAKTGELRDRGVQDADR